MSGETALQGCHSWVRGMGWLRHQEHRQNTHQHQPGHGQIGRLPAQPVGDVQGARPRHQHGKTIAEHIGGGHCALELIHRRLDAEGVDGHILGG